MARKNGRSVLYGRHFCKNCDNRVLPYDGFEALTESPAPGKKGNPILLYSENSARSKDNPEDTGRRAYCWVCMKWTETYRETRNELIVRYLKRKGVVFRFNGSGVTQETKVKAVAKRMDERRPAATLSSK